MSRPMSPAAIKVTPLGSIRIRQTRGARSTMCMIFMAVARAAGVMLGSTTNLLE